MDYRIVKQDFNTQAYFTGLPFQEAVYHLVVLDPEDKVVGRAVLGHNPYHPYCDEIGIWVSEPIRRQGAGTALLEALDDYSDRPLKVSLPSSLPGTAGFLLRNGFTKVRQCFEYKADLEDLIRREDLEEEVFEIQPISEASEEELEKIYSLLLENYQVAHEEVSPMSREISREEWLTAILEGVNSETSFFAHRDGEYGFIFTEIIDADTLAVAYAGGDLERINALPAFLLQAMHILGEKYKHFEFEVDSTSPYSMVFTSIFNFKPTSSWDAFVRE